MRWIPVTERLPEGSDAISCEAWCAAEIHRLTDLVVEAHDQLHRLVATFVPGNDGAYTKTTDLMRRIREALPGVAFDGSASGAALPLAPQPQWICPRCKVDRSKEACPRGNGGNCPMVGSAHGVIASDAPSGKPQCTHPDCGCHSLYQCVAEGGS